MNQTIGTYSLSLAVLVASSTVLASIAAARFDSRRLLMLAKGGICVIAMLLTAASIALLTALVDSDFSIQYVTHYTELALPTGYKVAAFWAGQEGSLLLWAWMLAAMSVVAVFTHRRKETLESAMFVATLAFLGTFFAALMLFAANPFTRSVDIPLDGHGLNPLLQNPGMIAHPPLLFMGYAGFSVPFALMIAALASGGKKVDVALGEVRNWTIFSWLFLSIGIVLGAQWAYEVLGWGGYWAWDPVENASLLPWLTATALLHSIIIQQHRGMFKVWNAALIAVTFLLCVFGTYITRSGVVQSVHSFGASLVGTFFLVFLSVCTLASIIMIVVRLKGLRSENALENMFGREGAFLITNVLLMIMTVATLVGTIFPVISGLMADQPVSVSQGFYNKVVIPLSLVLVALMACGPLLVYGENAGKRLAKGMIIPGVVGAIAVAVMLAMHISNPWALICGAIIAAAITSMLIDLFRAIGERAVKTGENVVLATLRLLDGNHRRYGGQLVHMGMLMVVAGVAGSSLFAVKETYQLVPEQVVQLGRYSIKYDALEDTQGKNYRSVQLTLLVTDPSGVIRALKPEHRFYDKAEQPSSEVAIASGLREDFYVTLAGWDDGGKQVAAQVIVNPLVNWIWIGGIVLGVGGIICLIPRLIPGSAQASPDNKSTSEVARSAA